MQPLIIRCSQQQVGFIYLVHSSCFFLKAATPFNGFSAPDIFLDLSFPYLKSQPDVKISIKAMTKINIALIFYISYLNPLTKLPFRNPLSCRHHPQNHGLPKNLNKEVPTK